VFPKTRVYGIVSLSTKKTILFRTKSVPKEIPLSYSEYFVPLAFLELIILLYDIGICQGKYP
jgi:hypothetical protein